MRSFAYFTLANVASASLHIMQQIENELEQLVMENPEDYGWMLPHIANSNQQEQPQLLRTVLGPLHEEGTSMYKLNGYGCYCNFDDSNSGFGAPVDDIDTSCKRLHDNYKCIEEEFAAKGQVCLPSEVEYNSDMLFVYIGEAMTAREFLKLGYVTEAHAITKREAFERYCLEQNQGNPCMQEACLAEAHFLYEISPAYYAPMDLTLNGMKSKYHHASGEFDPSSECRRSTRGSNQMTEAQCCGTTPNRVRYRDDRKSCCESSGQTYNMMHQCCDESGVLDIGNC